MLDSILVSIFRENILLHIYELDYFVTFFLARFHILIYHIWRLFTYFIENCRKKALVIEFKRIAQNSVRTFCIHDCNIEF